MKPQSARAIALELMLDVVERGRSLDESLRTRLAGAQSLSARDRAFVRELVSGQCRWYHALRELLDSRLQKPLRARDRDIECILIAGLYQLLLMRTGAHAAVNESVKLVQTRKKSWARGLVNAVLRGVVRDAVSIDQLSTASAYPAWMRDRIEADWGESAPALLEAGNQRPPMTLRIDTRRVERAAMLQQLAEADIAASPHARVDSAVTLESPRDVADLPGFETGLVSVQDASAQLAASLLACEPGERVLDACAAPGGKALHLLQSSESLELDALDSSGARLERFAENLERAGLDARRLVGDAATPGDWYDNRPYDAILADVPCSASGVMRRHPDIKLLRRESDIMPLLELQARILHSLWTVLRPGGRMLYCTCSIFREENDAQVERFLQTHADAERISLDHLDWGRPQSHGRQILTGDDDMDGFYYALLTRSAIQ